MFINRLNYVFLFFVTIVFIFKHLYILNNRLYRSNNFNVNDLINMLIIILSIEM